MMNGATIPRATQARKRKETVTRAASHAQAGTPRTLSVTEFDLGEPRCDLARVGRARLDPDIHRGGADVAQHLVGDSLPAGRFLERGDVEIGDVVEIVAAP